MTDELGPPEIEFEEPIRISAPTNKKRRKLIGLDDLLEDHEREQRRLNDRKSQANRIRKACDAEDAFDEAAEAQLSECVHKCEKEISKINGDEEMSTWGIRAFGKQEVLPQLEYPQLGNCNLVQSFVQHNISSLLELNADKVENFLEVALADGWLLLIVNMTGCVESSIAKWTFNMMLYSSEIRLMEAACEFWCAILCDKQDDSSKIKIDWLPGFSDVKGALQAYGFLSDSLSNISSDIDKIPADAVTTGPPQNIRCWIKFTNVCCHIRETEIIPSCEEAEDLLVIFISLFLDRKLVGLSLLLHEALDSIISFFRDDEWSETCENAAKSLANRLPCDLNCLRAVECITGVDSRSKQLRCSTSLACLMQYCCFTGEAALDQKSSNTEKILRWLISMNVKDKKCDLLKVYIYLSLSENWLCFHTATTRDEEVTVRQLWGGWLRNCSCGIGIADLRSYASNVRSKASYLLQSCVSDE